MCGEAQFILCDHLFNGLVCTFIGPVWVGGKCMPNPN